MNIRKLLIGEGAGQFLPFALSRVRFLASRFSHAVCQSFVVGDTNIRVHVNASPDNHYIRIKSGAPFYEFFTPDTVTGFPADVSGSITAVNPTTGKVAAITADTLTAPGIRVPTSTTSPPLCRSWASFNDQRNPQYIHWEQSASGAILGWTAATNIGPSSVHSWSFDAQFFSTARRPSDDIGLDLVPAFHNLAGRGPTRKIPNSFDPLADTLTPGVIVSRVYYGRACTQTAASAEFGSRRFYILTDSLSAFYIYPVEDDGTDTPIPGFFGIATCSNFVKIDAPLPMWASKATDTPMEASLGEVIAEDDATSEWVMGVNVQTQVRCAAIDTDEPALYTRYRYKWSFNSTGTRAAAVVASVPVADPDGSQRFVGYNAGIVSLGGIDVYGRPHDPDGWTKAVRSEPYPGVVELGVNIILTGPNLADFTASLSVVREFPATTDSPYYTTVDYAFGDKRLSDRGIARDTLMAAEMRMDRWTAAAGGVPSGYRTYLCAGAIGDPPVMSLLLSIAPSWSIGFEYVRLLNISGSHLGSAKLPVDHPVSAVPTVGVKRFDGTFINSISLRSLSFTLNLTRDNWPLNVSVPIGVDSYYFGSAVISYGTVVEMATGFVEGDFLNVPTVAEKLPVRERFGTYTITSQRMGISNGINVMNLRGVISEHPKGNIAFYWRPKFELFSPLYPGTKPAVIDRIERIKKDEVGDVVQTTLTTHRDAFNKAFFPDGPAREYAFYTPGQPGDQGGFCSWGVWSTNSVRYNLPKEWEAP